MYWYIDCIDILIGLIGLIVLIVLVHWLYWYIDFIGILIVLIDWLYWYIDCIDFVKRILSANDGNYINGMCYIANGECFWISLSSKRHLGDEIGEMYFSTLYAFNRTELDCNLFDYFLDRTNKEWLKNTRIWHG